MKFSKVLSLVLAILLTLTLFTACNGKETTTKTDGSKTIKVGFIGPLTGEVAVYGIAAQNAAKLYIDEVNKAGGIGGRQIELISYDDKGDATEAVNAYNRLVYQDEAVSIIGPITSTPTIAVAQKSVEDNIPIMTPTATHPDVTSFGNNTFRACFLDPFQGSTMAKFAVNSLKAKKAAVIYNTSDSYSTGLFESFTKTAKEVGLEIVASEGYAKGDVDFKAQLTNIKEKNPDVLFVPEYYNNVYLIASQSKTLGLNATLLGVDGTDGVLAIEGADHSVYDGLYFANHYSTDDTSPIVQNFLKSFKDTYGQDPNALAALGYDGTVILLDAMKKVAEKMELSNTDECKNAIIDALEATDLDCVTGHVTYDKDNNPVKTCAIIKIETENVNGKVQGKYKLFTKA